MDIAFYASFGTSAILSGVALAEHFGVNATERVLYREGVVAAERAGFVASDMAKAVQARSAAGTAWGVTSLIGMPTTGFNLREFGGAIWHALPGPATYYAWQRRGAACGS